MDTHSAVSLLVEFDIPPTKIIEAIRDGHLRPILTSNNPVTLDDIHFSADEVSQIFYAYEFRYKAKDEKENLARRLRRFDAIVDGVIAAVIASGITALFSETLRRDDLSHDHEEAVPDRWARAPGMPDFGWPLLRPPDDFPVRLERDELFIMSRRPFMLIAAADGMRLPEQSNSQRLTMMHGVDWMTSYRLLNGTMRQLFNTGDGIERGSPVALVKPAPVSGARVGASILRRTEGNYFEPISADYWNLS